MLTALMQLILVENEIDFRAWYLYLVNNLYQTNLLQFHISLTFYKTDKPNVRPVGNGTQVTKMIYSTEINYRGLTTNRYPMPVPRQGAACATWRAIAP